MISSAIKHESSKKEWEKLKMRYETIALQPKKIVCRTVIKYVIFNFNYSLKIHGKYRTKIESSVASYYMYVCCIDV